MSGPPPKPANIRQRANKKAGHATITAPKRPRIPAIPNPDAREWHALTQAAWNNAWASPMATQWLETDVDALGRLALLWDAFYRGPRADLLGEIRLQEQRFGLSPLDRSRLQWEVSRADEAQEKQNRRKGAAPSKRAAVGDPRAVLSLVKGA